MAEPARPCAALLLREIRLARLGERLVQFPQKPGRWIYVVYKLAAIAAALGRTGGMTIRARLK
jgi:hypothetical protein